MQLQVHPKVKTVQITDDTRQYLEKKLSKLNRHFRREPEAQFTQGFERGLHLVEVTLNGDDILLRSQERNGDLRAAIDGAIHKLETQLKRFKSKRVDGHRQPSPARSGGEGEAEFTPRIVRRKNFPMKSMPPEEAARQMELLAHSFFVFLNEETQRVAVLYRRENGDYGLIEPED
jgi:putative sigma-54 modulation protein